MRAIVVTGGREIVPTKETLNAFWRWLNEMFGADFVVICGDCRGVDITVAKFVEGKGSHVIHMPALWGPKGKGAGFLRNMRMCEVARAIDRHAILVPWPGGPGTESCKRCAKVCGLEVVTAAEIATKWGAP